MIPITRILYKQLRGHYLIEVMGTDWFTWWRPIDDYSSMNRIDNELDFAVGRTFAAADMNHVAHRELARPGYVMVDIKCNIQLKMRSKNNSIHETNSQTKQL